MASRWPKIIRDPIHDIISLEDNDTDKLVLDLIDAKEFQRLRRIKQLGMCDLVFPGANHSRLSHSIGAMHIAAKVLDRMDRFRNEKLKPEERVIVILAALLHDIGHGPFSHSFERVMDTDHEAWTRKIIVDDSTEINQKLKDFDELLPQRLANFLEGVPVEEVPPVLSQIVSSQLDVDRFDYLLRDSHATGTD